MLESIEQDARSRECKGVVAWAVEWDAWNPVSFYEHMGYDRADQEGDVIAVWKPFSAGLYPFPATPYTYSSRPSTCAVRFWLELRYSSRTSRPEVATIEFLRSSSRAPGGKSKMRSALLK